MDLGESGIDPGNEQISESRWPQYIFNLSDSSTIKSYRSLKLGMSFSKKYSIYKNKCFSRTQLRDRTHMVRILKMGPGYWDSSPSRENKIPGEKIKFLVSPINSATIPDP